MSRLKFAVVGAGALGRHHARILSQLHAVELIGVADINPESGRRVAADCGTSWVSDYRELLEDVDAVSIVVPTSAHLEVASEFIMRRIPVLVEKPLATNATEAEQLHAQAESQGALLQVGHIERFNPAVATTWKVCGRPKYIRAERLSPYAFRSTDIGAIHDLMIHDIDLTLDLVRSTVRRVEAFGISILGDHEDTVQTRITFENGCIADLTASRVHSSARRIFQVWSAAGSVTADLHAGTVVSYGPSDLLRYGTSPLERAREPGADIEQLKREIFGKYIEQDSHPVPKVDALTAELESFIDCVRTGSAPLVGGRQAVEAMQLAEQIRESVATHQWDGRRDGPIGPFISETSFSESSSQRRAG